MWSVRRVLLWICRCRYSRGFGVQSPWAYRFVRYVINEHYPYYAYSDLKKIWRNLNDKERRLCKFYFRLSNYLQAKNILDYRPEDAAYSAYMHRGCLKSKIDSACDGSEIKDESYQLVRMSLTGDYQLTFKKLLSQGRKDMVIVLQDIYDNRLTRQFWKSVTEDMDCVTTFDLYYCGVVFLDHKRYKQNYIINF